MEIYISRGVNFCFKHNFLVCGTFPKSKHKQSPFTKSMNSKSLVQITHIHACMALPLTIGLTFATPNPCQQVF